MVAAVETFEQPMVPVLATARQRSYPKHAEGGAAIYMPIGKALTSTFRTDAHFAGYSVPEIKRRLTKTITAIPGADVSMVMLTFDDDAPGHVATDEWRNSERAKLVDLLQPDEHPGGFVYPTRGGYRIGYLLPVTIFIRDDEDARAWRALYVSYCKYLARRFDIHADQSCKEWGRLFRLPYATRDGVRPEQLETIGDPNQIGTWHCELTSADFADDEIKNTAKVRDSPRSSSYNGRGRLVAAFDGRGWLGDDLGPGKYAARCPWESEHTTGESFDSSTVVYEADAGDLGWFHCLHSHCQGRTPEQVIALFTDEELGNPKKCGATTKSGKTCAATELLEDGRCAYHTSTRRPNALRDHQHDAPPEWMNDAPPPDDRPDATPPIIRLGPDQPRVLDEGLAALAPRADVYNRGGVLVEVIVDSPETRGVTRLGSMARIARCQEARLLELLAGAATWQSYDGGGGWRRVHPPQWVVRGIMARGTWSGIRPIVAVLEASTMRLDGSILSRAGYDAATGIYLAPAIEVAIPDRPTRADAQRAIGALLDVIADFPVTSAAGRSAWLAGVLSIAARPAIDGPTPAIIVDASQRGAGKTLMVDAASAITTGRAAARMIYSEDATETRKVITALALVGDPSVLLDNVVGELGDAALDAALTGTVWRDRILGASALTAELPLRMQWWATGNGLTIGADLIRRALLVRLEPAVERPEERQGFRHARLLEHIRDRRAELLGAALTIVRAYHVAGRPVMQLRPMGSFEAWSDLVRSALVWARAADPCDTVTELRAADARAVAFRAAVEHWPAETDDPITANELLQRATPQTSWRAALVEWCSPRPGADLPTARALGYALRGARRQVVAGHMLDSAERGELGARWVRVRLGGK